MGWQLAYQTEAKFFAKYIPQTKPDAKIAVLYQNDYRGRDYLKGLRDGLGDKASTMIVAEASCGATGPTVDSQIVMLKSAGADTLMTFASVKAAAQAIDAFRRQAMGAVRRDSREKGATVRASL